MLKRIVKAVVWCWKVKKAIVIVAILLIFSAVMIGLGVFFSGNFGFSDKVMSVQARVTIQKELQNQFIVVGELETLATVTTKVGSGYNIGNTRRLNFGETEFEVTVPGKIGYGFDMKDVAARDIVIKDGVVMLSLPVTTVYSAEPQLDKAMIRSSSGLINYIRPNARITARDEAYSKMTEALRLQGEEHMKENQQPRINAARALIPILDRTLEAAKVEVKEYQFKFDTGEVLVVKPEGARK